MSKRNGTGQEKSRRALRVRGPGSRAEKVLRESEEKYRNLFENGKDAVILADARTGIIVDVNPAGCRLLGLPKKKIIGRHQSQIHPPELAEKYKEVFREHVAKGLVVSEDTVVQRADGSRVQCEITATVSKFGDGHIIQGVFRDITERKLMEKALADEATRRRILVEQSRDGIVILDQDGKVYEANLRFAEMLGYSQEEVMKLDVWDWEYLYPPEKVKEMIRTVTEDGDHFETRHRRKDGSIYDVEISTNAATFAGQKLIFCVCRDITERKRAEEALRESQDFNTNLLDKAPNQVVVINPDTSIKYVNPSWEKLNGWTREEVIGVKIPYPWWPEDMVEAFMEAFPASMNGEEGRGEVVARKKNGELYWLSMNWTPVKRDGELMYLLVNSVDITEQKKAEEALKESEEKFSKAFRSSPESISITRLDDGQFIEVNDGFLQSSGYTREEVIGHSAIEIGLWPDNTGRERMLRLLEKDRRVSNEEFQFVIKSGEVRTVLLSTDLITIGGEQCIISVCNDITERKQMENELRQHRDNLEKLVLERTNELSDTNRRLKQELEIREKIEQQLLRAKNDAETANRAKTEFLARTSHEIRTPIHGVMGMINLVLDSQLQPDQRQYLKMAMESAESLLNIINDILDLSKIEVGQLEPARADFNLRATLEDTLDSMAVAAFKKGLEFTSWIPHDLPTALVGDEGWLRQVLVNLIGNANKFTERGEIALSVETVDVTDKEVEFHFTIRDTGIGIPADKQSIIFEPFQQADGSINRQYGGTGLGLAISRRLIAKMGGRIWVESVPGEGSTFHFTSRFTRQPAEKRGDQLPEMPPVLRGMPVLFVDDNASSRKVLREILSGWGIPANEAESGPAALEEMERAERASRPYRLAFIDKNMPDMNGFELAEKILCRQTAPPVIVMMLPPDSISNDFHRCQELGIASYTVKPIRESRLHDVILKATGLAKESPAGSSLIVPTGRELHLYILVAEDNVTSQLIARKTLEKMGHTVDIVANGLEATCRLEKNSYDLVLMDAEMPVMNGLEATRYIRRQERGCGRHIPIVAMTAYAMEEDRKKCLEAGMDGYLSKPAKPDDINNILNELYTGETKAAPPAVDMDTAMKVFGGDNALMKEAAGIFLAEDYPEQIAIIKEGISKQDAPIVKAAAHSVKGAARSLGGIVLGDVAWRLEEAGRNGDLAKAPELVAEMEIEVKRFSDFFQEKKG